MAAAHPIANNRLKLLDGGAPWHSTKMRNLRGFSVPYRPASDLQGGSDIDTFLRELGLDGPEPPTQASHPESDYGFEDRNRGRAAPSLSPTTTGLPTPAIATVTF